MASLTALSGDCIGLVIEKVEAVGVLRLVLCGSRNLNAKLFSNSKSLVLARSKPRPMIWPPILAGFRNLQNFTFESDYPYTGVPGRGVKVADLPPTLQSLTLRYFDPISDMFEPYIDAQLGRLSHREGGFAQRFPNLTKLSLVGTPPYEAEVFKLFPSTLTDLQLHANSDFEVFPHLLDLPIGLKNLSVGTALQTRKGVKVEFPPNLESLTLWMNECPRDDWMCNLPQSLKELTFMAWSNYTNMALQWNDLPRGLTAYSQWGCPVSLTKDIVLNGLPPHIEHLEIEVELNESMDWVQYLPKSVTYFDAASHVFQPEQYASIPSYMRSVELRDSELTTLPSALQSLTLTSGTLSTGSLEYLPSSLHTLSIYNANDEVAAGLSRLSLLRSFTMKTGSLSPEGCKSLPRSIRTLNVHSTGFGDLECIPNLPELESLTIWDPYPPVAPAGAPSALKTVPAALLLPLSLKRISIFVENWINVEWTQALQRLVNLEYLMTTHMDKLPEEILTKLPPNLTSLNASLQRLGHLKDTISGLPRKLTSLELSCPSESSKLTAADLAHLPRSLYYLSIPASAGLTTEEAFANLPPFLHQFQVSWRPVPQFDNKYDPFRSNRRKPLTDDEIRQLDP